MNARASSSSAAFTLIELLVALVILSTGIVVVLEAFQTSLSALGRTRESLLADMLLRGKLAEIEWQARASSAAPPADGSGRFAGEYGAYAWAQQVESRAPGERTGAPAYRVTVTVWGDGSTVRRAATTVVRLPPPAEEKQ